MPALCLTFLSLYFFLLSAKATPDDHASDCGIACNVHDIPRLPHARTPLDHPGNLC